MRTVDEESKGTYASRYSVTTEEDQSTKATPPVLNYFDPKSANKPRAISERMELLIAKERQFRRHSGPGKSILRPESKVIQAPVEKKEKPAVNEVKFEP